jgi:low affinity Fe/Cu permease
MRRKERNSGENGEQPEIVPQEGLLQNLKCIAVAAVAVERGSSAPSATDRLGGAGVCSTNSEFTEARRMKKPAIEEPVAVPVAVKDRTVHDHFGRFAAVASGWLGSTWAFAGAGLVVAVWAAAGPVFHFSQTWAQVIGTGTGIATFLMVFLIQSTQNRDSRAINLKLNELIRAMDTARNQLIDIERLSDLELDEMQATYEKIKTTWTERQTRAQSGPQVK